MKKFFSILTFSLFCTLFLTSCSNFPKEHPTLNITCDNSNSNLSYTINGGNWFDEDKGGNSFNLGEPIEKTVSSMDANKVPCNSVLKLKLSYTDNIKNFKVYKIDTSSNDYSLTEIDASNNEIPAPSTPGEYCYKVSAEWDNTHNVNYLFKILCTEKEEP